MFLRFDAEGFAGRPPGVPRQNDFRLERFGLDLERGDLHLQLGDLYAQFGRGLALSMRRIDELGLDVALRGGRLDFGMADGRMVTTLLAGVSNPVIGSLFSSKENTTHTSSRSRAAGCPVVKAFTAAWFWDTGILARAIGHAEADLILPLSTRLSLHAIAREQLHAEGDSANRYVYHRGSASLELDRDNRITVVRWHRLGHPEPKS